MERYKDNDTIKGTRFTKYKIIVPSEQDKSELEEAFEHIHYSDIDTEYVPVNQLAHEYLTSEITGDDRVKNNIIVDSKLYHKLSSDHT